jgi:hypothetical protein
MKNSLEGHRSTMIWLMVAIQATKWLNTDQKH